MISVPLVDDDVQKVRRIIETFVPIPEYAAKDITHVKDALSAKRALSAQHFDLMVIDIAIPTLPDSEVARLEGLDLLEE